MSSKKENNRLESIRDAALGYTIVVLATVCFLIALAAVIIAVRFVVGLGASNATAVATANPTATAVKVRS